MMSEKLTDMFNLQIELNKKLRGRFWREQNLDWHRAIWTECAELLESFPWKWWKKTDTNWYNIHIELVDIWHFGMSLLLQKNKQETLLTDPIVMEPVGRNYNIFEEIENIASSALMKREFHYPAFFSLCYQCNLSLDDLYSLYTGKQILNKFRNDHGYSTGEYCKTWAGEEDNVVMYNLVMKDRRRSDKLYDILEEKYKIVLEAHYNGNNGN
jgi:hypothetical protein